MGKGNFALETSIGGPLMTNLGFACPIPNLFMGGRFGIREDLDVAGHLNLTLPIIPGVFDLITDVHWVPVQPGIRFQKSTTDRGWGAGISSSVQWITDFQNGLVILPALDLSGSYRCRWISFFTGASFGGNFYRPEESDNSLQLSPYLGIEFITSKKLSFGIKCTAFDILYNFNGSQTEWIYLLDDVEQRKKHAPLGVAIGLGWQVGKRRKEPETKVVVRQN